MICVTGAEPSLGALARRIEALPWAPLHEARLDLLDALPASDALAFPDSQGLVVTVRDAAEGGRFHGPWEAKARLLGAALAAGARYVDLEADAPDALWQALAAAYGAHRLVASLHRFAPGEVSAAALAPLIARLAARPAGVLKLAVALRDVCELDALRALALPDDRPLVRIGMGLAGQAGRVAWRALGSPWTYVAAPGAGATAPGQVGWEGLARFAGPEAPPPRLLALLGGDNVAHSPGPRVYTALACEQGLPFVYVAAPTADPVRALETLAALGLAGASVTMPHKATVRAAAWPVGFAARVGAVNTVVPCDPEHHGEHHHDLPPGGAGEPGPAFRWVGHNTDGLGVLGALAPALAAGPQRAVVLGTGGAARAAAFALAEAGHRVTVLGRRVEAAEALAAELNGAASSAAAADAASRTAAGGKGPARGAALDTFGEHPFDVLVNATPVGSAPGASPVPTDGPWAGRTVLDMLLAPRETPLLAAARAGGGQAVPGVAMWTHQGAAQWRLFTGRAVDPARLAALVEAEAAP